MLMEWREIHHNLMVADYASQEAVDNDDGSAYYHTHHNFFVYADHTLKSDFGGHDNVHSRSIPRQSVDFISNSVVCMCEVA